MKIYGKMVKLSRLLLLHLFSVLLMACPSVKEKTENNPSQYELSQKSELTPIYDQFYRNKNGYIYQRTIAQRNINGKLQDVEYFNGVLPQDIDPMTFKQIMIKNEMTWYAKDKNQIYVSRPTGGGMQINPLKEADWKSFRPLDYNLAVDKNHYYQEGQIIENFNPNETQIIKNPQGQIIALQSHEKIYHLDD